MEPIKVSGLWKAKDKNGNTYLHGKLTEIAVIWVMPNSYKKGNDPDYYLYIGPRQQKGQSKDKDRAEDL